MLINGSDGWLGAGGVLPDKGRVWSESCTLRRDTLRNESVPDTPKYWALACLAASLCRYQVGTEASEAGIMPPMVRPDRKNR